MADTAGAIGEGMGGGGYRKSIAKYCSGLRPDFVSGLTIVVTGQK